MVAEVIAVEEEVVVIVVDLIEKVAVVGVVVVVVVVVVVMFYCLSMCLNPERKEQFADVIYCISFLCNSSCGSSQLEIFLKLNDNCLID